MIQLTFQTDLLSVNVLGHFFSFTSLPLDVFFAVKTVHVCIVYMYSC